MDDKSGRDQRHQSGATDCFCFPDRVSSQNANPTGRVCIFWEVELTGCGDGDRAAPAATAPGAAVPLHPKLIPPGFGGSFGTEDRYFRFFCQGKLLEIGLLGTLKPAPILSPCAN